VSLLAAFRDGARSRKPTPGNLCPPEPGDVAVTVRLRGISRPRCLGTTSKPRSGEGHAFSCRFRGRAQVPGVGEGAEPSQDDPGIPGSVACGQLGKFGAVTIDPADRAEQTCGGQIWVLGGLGSLGGEEDEPGLAFAGVW